jgi:hypothetical protein
MATDAIRASTKATKVIMARFHLFSASLPQDVSYHISLPEPTSDQPYSGYSESVDGIAGSERYNRHQQV